MEFNFICLTCNKPFKHRKNDKKYCSSICYSKRFGISKLNCEICKQEFSVPYRFRFQKTCGKICFGKMMSQKLTGDRLTKNCLKCGIEYQTNLANTTKYCSLDCFYQHKYKRVSKFLIKECEHCKVKFPCPFTKRDKRFCTRKCGGTGIFNSMFGKRYKWPTGKKAWNNGLTKHTDERLRKVGEKISVIVSDKIINGEWSPSSTKFKGQHYVGIKNGGKKIYLRSSYEKIYADHLDTNPEVTSWIYEPFRIPYFFENSQHNYIPDFLIQKSNDVQELIEVKPECYKESDVVLAKQLAAQYFCSLNSIDFKIISENDLKYYLS